MDNALQARLTKSQLDRFSATLGAAPVLSSEDARHYNEIWDNLIKRFMPKDFLELLLTRQVQNETWKIMRYTRHQTVAIDRRFQESREFQVKRANEQKARRAAVAKELAEKTGQPATELQRLLDLNDVVMSSLSDVDEILLRPPTEIDHNRALEAGISLHMQLDKLINSAWARRNNALQQLELYREDLGQSWRQISDALVKEDREIITVATAETEELARRIASPPMAPAPADEPPNAVASDHGEPAQKSVAPDGAGSTDTSELSHQEST
jgi:hypothetical protein